MVTSSPERAGNMCILLVNWFHWRPNQ